MVNTVLGQIEIEKLGVSLAHEHVIVNPNTPSPDYDDFRLTDTEKAIEDLLELKSIGCDTIVDMAPINFGRDASKLIEISKATAMNIIMTTGYHKEEFMPDYVNEATIEELTSIILNEALEGIDGTGVRPGVIKCGSSLNEISSNELKCFKAACEAHKQLGLPISTHSDKGTMLLEQLEIFKEEKVNLKKVVLGHVDLSFNQEVVVELLKSDVFIQFDHIGRGDKNDNFVLDMVKVAVDLNRQKQVLISQDMGRKKYLASYEGSPGLTYAFEGFKEKFLDRFSEDLFDQIFVSNVASLFK